MAVKKTNLVAASMLFSFNLQTHAGESIRDPFATLSNAPAAPKTLALIDTSKTNRAKGLALRAILWGQQPLANISGMIVAEGDRVHDYTVIQLSRKTAVLRQDNDTILLVLEEAG